jgi:hypothetical protein
MKQFAGYSLLKFFLKTTILNFSGVNDPAEIVSVGSMTPLKSFQRGQ